MQAAKRGLTYPRYAWIAYDWYPRGWWKVDEKGEGDLECNTEILKTFLKGTISLRRYPAPDDSSAVTDAGIVSTPKLMAFYFIIIKTHKTSYQPIPKLWCLLGVAGTNSIISN